MSTVNTDEPSGRASMLLTNLNMPDVMCKCVNGKNAHDDDWRSSSQPRDGRVKYLQFIQFSEATTRLVDAALPTTAGSKAEAELITIETTTSPSSSSAP
eukprot:5029435-Heterocapsa_arctica.AAC.1